jgi:hypothetical protein
VCGQKICAIHTVGNRRYTTVRRYYWFQFRSWFLALNDESQEEVRNQELHTVPTVP